MEPISATIITKDQVEPTLRAVGSLLDQFLGPNDEIVILDTGSSNEHFAQLKSRAAEIDARTDTPAVRVLDGRDLSVPLQPYLDDWLPEWAERLGADPQYRDLRGILSFADARNRVTEAAKNDLIFWIDSDDVLEEEQPGSLRRVIEETVAKDGAPYNALFLEYRYGFAEDGTLTTTLKRERVFRKSTWEWKGNCHETAIPKPGVEARPGYCQDLPSWIRHTEARKKHAISDIRNYVILRNELEGQSADEIDPRTLFYFANAARGLDRFAESIDLYKQFMPRSGSPDDRYAAAYYIANTYLHPSVRRPVDAADWFGMCQDIKPLDPRGHFGMSRAYLAQCKYEAALHQYRCGLSLPMPETAHSVDPTHIQHKPHLVAADAARELGDLETAYECAAKAAEARPGDKETQQYFKMIESARAGTRLAQSIEHVGRHIRGGGANAKRVVQTVFAEMPAVPSELERMGVGRLEDPDPREERPAVAIYCGGTLEEWGPMSEKTGIGGSEKMAILLSRALQRRGLNVTIYASTPYPQRGIDSGGVRWCHFSEFDKSIPRQALIGWRNPAAVALPVPAKRRIIWLHDVQNPETYQPEIVATADWINLQSQYHKQPLVGVVPEEKLWVARNAIARPPGLSWSKKDPKRVIYFSCPTRGLTTAARLVELVQAVDPEINLTVAYGFSPFARKMRQRATHQHVPDIGRDTSMDDFERAFGRHIDLTGARLLNRVSFERMGVELERAGVWLYPTRFPEISCMAAMEAQAWGVIPVATRYGALAETILPAADKLVGPLPELPARGDPPKDWWQTTAALLKAATEFGATDERRKALAEAAGEAFDVEALADEWYEKIMS